MSKDQLQEEIKDINLSYLLLARQMIHEDKPAAIFRLGINEELADLVAGLSPVQLLRIADSKLLLCRFRFDEKLLLTILSDYNKDRLMSQTHAAILMVGQPMASMAV